MWLVEFVKERPDLAAIMVLIAVMVVDTMLGLLVAAQDGVVEPKEMHAGITKKLGTLLIVIGVQFIAVLMPDLVGRQPAGAMAASAYVVAELLSITRNMAILGIGIPAPLRAIFASHDQKGS